MQYYVTLFYSLYHHITLDVCECDANKVCIPAADIQDKTQNSAINICISTDFDGGFNIAGIKEMKIVDKASSLSYAAIIEYTPNAITDVAGGGSKNVIVSTRLVSFFFSELSNTGGTAQLQITGTAVLEFASGRRRLTNFQASNNKGKNLIVRESEDDTTGLGEFEMGIGISGSSTRSESFMTKATAQIFILLLAGFFLCKCWLGVSIVSKCK